MKRRAKAMIAALVLGLLVGLPLGTASLIAKDDVPLKGDGTSKYLGEDIDGIFATAYWEITGGNVTHLGKVTGEAEVYWMRISDDPVIYIPLGAMLILEAADGDELHMTQMPTGFDPSTVTVYSTFTITGGTGRFLGATGSGVATASGTGTVKNTWNGTIDYKKN
jgi:hypothetical protein